MKKAVVLLSGGLDSAATLYLARRQGFKCLCLIFDYGQRHKREIDAAKKIARIAGCKFWIVAVNLPWKGSALLDSKLPIRIKGHTARQADIPSTYVPARNIIFLSFALSCAEAINAEAIFIGAHSQDYSGYPDCRPEFYRAFSKMISCGTKTGVEKRGVKVMTPLIYKTKAQIVRLAAQLGVPLASTWSCYQGGAVPCGACDSCYFRAKGFREAGIKDPLSADRH